MRTLQLEGHRSPWSWLSGEEESPEYHCTGGGHGNSITHMPLLVTAYCLSTYLHCELGFSLFYTAKNMILICKIKRLRFAQEAVTLKDGCLNVSVHACQRVKHMSEIFCTQIKAMDERDVDRCHVIKQGYSLGRSSLMEAILKNQLRHVSLAVSFTSSTVKPSEDVLDKT